MADMHQTDGSGFSAAERESMKQRAAELRAEKADGKGAAKRARELQACEEAIGLLDGTDREIADLLHRIVHEFAPELDPKTWYGFPSYAKDGKVIVFFQPASRFKARYATVGFNEDANLDEGVMWPTSFAVTEVNAAVEKHLTDLVLKAVS